MDIQRIVNIQASQQTTNMNDKPQGNYFQRIQNDMLYKIDPITGRAKRRTTAGTVLQTLNPLKFVSNIGTANYSDVEKQDKSNADFNGAAYPRVQTPTAPQMPTQDYSQQSYQVPQMPQDMSGYSMGDTSSGAPEMNNLQAMFGPNIKSMDDLMAMRNRLNDIRQRAAFGLKVDDKEYADALSLDMGKASPQQINALLSARKDMFATPISKIDDYIQKQSQAQSYGSGFFGNIPNQYRDDIWKMRSEFQNLPIVKEMQTLGPSYTLIANLDPKTMSNSDAQSALIAFTKALDPTSVVREGELALTTAYASNPSLLNQLRNEYSKLIQGKVVRPQAIQQIAEAFKNRYSALQQNYDQTRKQYQGNASYFYGLDDATNSQLFNDYSAPGSRQSNMSVNPYAKDSQYGDMYPNGDGTYSPKASGTSGSPVTSLSDAKRRIASNEGNNYLAYGPLVTSGQYKGEKAIGKYQVMPGNIPSWTKEALGFSMTPEQFRTSPQAQEAVASHRMSVLFNKYHNWNDVASAWFTGGPVNSNNGKKKDDLGTSGYEYVRRFNA